MLIRRYSSPRTESRSSAAWPTAVALCLVLVHAIPSPARGEIPVDVQLVLAIDSSESVDPAEYAVQIDGLADAFRDPAVHEAIASGPNGSIAVSVVEWSSDGHRAVQLPWTRLDGPATASSFAEQIGVLDRSSDEGATSISGAIEFAARQFEGNGFMSARRIIDISSDGIHNQGPRLDLAREAALAGDITINAIVILSEVPDLEQYFRQRVIGGVGAFVIAVDDHRTYPEAIRRKLIAEIDRTRIAWLDGMTEQLVRQP